MSVTWLQVLSQRDHIHAGLAQHAHGQRDLLISLTEADHDAGLDADVWS
jgi:hypothetical protein